tara:strand:+ start:206 stop:715 length:510 start_codon:yes stop_codon:yes gene_type:complete
MSESFENIAYAWEMLIVEHYATVRKILKCDYSSYVILELVASHYIYNKKKDDENVNKTSWKALWKLHDDEKFKDVIYKTYNILTVSSVSLITGMPHESVRRKVNALLDQKILEKKDGGLQLGKKFESYFKILAAKEVEMLRNFITEIETNGGLDWLKSEEATKIIFENG